MSDALTCDNEECEAFISLPATGWIVGATLMIGDDSFEGQDFCSIVCLEAERNQLYKTLKVKAS